MGTYGFPRVHLRQVSLEPPNRPGGFAFDRLIVELLIRGFDYQRNIHDATTVRCCRWLELNTADKPDQTSRVSVCGGTRRTIGWLDLFRCYLSTTTAMMSHNQIVIL